MSLNEVPSLFARKTVAPPEILMQEPSTSATTLKLFRGSQDIGKYVSSPFVTKIEFRLRLADVPYALDAGAPWLGPKGKIPYMEVAAEARKAGDKPTMLGDSTLIIQHLVGDSTLTNLNENLTPLERSRDLGLRSLLEDKLYFYHMRECWVDNYHMQREQALWAVPYPIRILVGRSVYKKVTTTLHGQGVGRYSDAEVQSFREEVWHSFDDLLQGVRPSQSSDPKQPFWILGGDQPTEADITLYSFVASILTASSCPGSQKLIRSLDAVVDYADRIHDVYFSDYEKWSPKAEPVAARL